jgi:sugar lactone lactonase YvrE
MEANASVVLDDLIFGEGPRWHGGRLWFSDFFAHVVRALGPDGRTERIVEVPAQPSGLGWLPDGRLLVVSMIDRKVLRLEPRGLVVHADLSEVADFHANDMVVGPGGRAYVGNFGSDLGGGDPLVPARLALVHPDGRVETAAEDLVFPNGSVITPDGRTLIVAETLGQRLTAFTIGAGGALTERRTWADLAGHHPDGCCLDVEGGIWFADPPNYQCLRVDQTGAITDRVTTSRPCIACALGGSDRRTLYLTTTWFSDPENRPDDGPLGALEAASVVRPGAGWP